MSPPVSTSVARSKAIAGYLNAAAHCEPAPLPPPTPADINPDGSLTSTYTMRIQLLRGMPIATIASIHGLSDETVERFAAAMKQLEVQE